MNRWKCCAKRVNKTPAPDSRATKAEGLSQPLTQRYHEYADDMVKTGRSRIMNIPHNIPDSIAAPAVTISAGWLSIEAATQSFNLLAAFFAMVAAILGVIWSWVRLRAAWKETQNPKPKKD